MRGFLSSKRNASLALLTLLLLISLPVTLIVLQKPQEDRSHAQASTLLSFSPASTQTSPTQVSLNDSVSLQPMLDPGNNLVSIVKLEIDYDPTKLAPDGTNAFTPNTTSFPTVLEGPIYDSGKMQVLISVGSDPTKAISTPTSLGTIKLKAISPTNNATTEVTYNTNVVQILSVASSDQAAENVFSSATPAYISINSSSTPTITTMPTSTNVKIISPALNDTICMGKPYTITWQGTTDIQGIMFQIVSPQPNSFAVPISSVLAINGQPVSGKSGYIQDSYIWTVGQLLSNQFGALAPGFGYKLEALAYVGNSDTVFDSDLFSISNNSNCSNTPTLVPTSTPIPSTTLSLAIFLHGVGLSGDNVNENNSDLSNKMPLHPERNLIVEFTNDQNKLLATANTTITYNSDLGDFIGTVPVPNVVGNGSYNITVKTDKYLRKLVSGIQNLRLYQMNTLPKITLTAGDVNGDNKLDLLDYNILLECGYGTIDDLPMTDPNSLFNSPTCQEDQANAANADLNDDGIIDSQDFNLFIRELSVQNGSSQ